MKKIKELFQRHFLAIGFFLAIAATAAVIICDLYALPNSFVNTIAGTRLTAYATIASIGGSLLGFILTAASVIIVYGESPRFQILRDSGHYQTVFVVYFNAIGCLSALTIWSFVGMFFDTDALFRRWISYSEIFLCVLCVARTWNCVSILWKMTAIAVAPVPDAVRRPNSRAA